MAAAVSLDRLGPLYRDIGLDTNPDLVAGRLKVAQGQLKKLGAGDVVLLVRAALGLAKPSELGDFVAPYQAADPTFLPDNGNREIAALAAAILSDVVGGSQDFAQRGALVTCTASFGGARRYADPELLAHAELSLTRLQTELRAAPPEITYHKIPDQKDLLDAFAANGEATNFPAAALQVKELIGNLSGHTETAVLDLARKLGALQRHQQRLQEDMNAQWWVMGGWSSTANRPFREIALPEAAVLAGRELAELTATSIGLAAAPALTNRIIEVGRKQPIAKASISSVVGALSSEFLALWTAKLAPEAVEAALVPLTLAGALALESAGAEDWKPRFQRLTGLSADVKLSPNDIAMQIYREALSRRLLAV